MKRALITGVGGQDGTYLAEYLLSLDYVVYGTVRAKVSEALTKLPDVRLLYADMRDRTSLETAILKSRPDEIYNLAGQPFVPQSWSCGGDTIDINTIGLQQILSLVSAIDPRIKVYQASSSEMFGNEALLKECSPGSRVALHEDRPMKPVSPYGVSKLASHHLCRIYRERGLFVCSGILFNHESPRRGEEMVTRKIARAVAQWKLRPQNAWPDLELGNLEAERDWGFAGDYVRAMHLMLQQGEADDYVIGTGESHSVNEFLDAALQVANISRSDIAPKIKILEQFKRHNELHVLLANPQKAWTKLNWSPKYDFSNLVAMMVNHEMDELKGFTNESLKLATT